MSYVIPSNRYSDRTIHVAECLLNDEDIGELIDSARRQVTKHEQAAGYDPNDSPTLIEALACELESYVDCFIDNLDWDEVRCLFAPAAMYMYMRDVRWEGVAELVLEHAPVAA